MAKITFYGAAREVTGSCYLLDNGRDKILLDCGMHQGGDATDRLEKESFGFDPKSLNAVVLSHAHLDHSGLLPRLVNGGFSGPIYCTEGTRQLLRILLEDAANIYFRDLDYDNQVRRRAGKRVKPARYTPDDVRQVLNGCHALDYHQREAVAAGFELCFHDAGHILGSSIVELTIDDGGRKKTLVFSGDLGNPETSLMNHYEYLDNADLVLLESTYGDRDHRASDETLEEFRRILEQAREEGGNIMIPSFAVGRTQELLFHLGLFYQEGILDDWQVFLDSPMGHAVTSLYASYARFLDPEDVATITRNGDRAPTAFLPNLTITESVEDSIAINKIKQGVIIIAGSGMCTGGRIRHHLKHRLWDRRNHLVFVGFQAVDTLGRIIVDGVKKVKIYGQWIAVKAQIHTLGGFSAHAGQGDLVDWISHFRSKPRVCLVHGEPDTMAVLQAKLGRERGIKTHIPAIGDSLEF